MPAARSLRFRKCSPGATTVISWKSRASFSERGPQARNARESYADVAIQDGVVRAALWDSAPEDVAVHRCASQAAREHRHDLRQHDSFAAYRSCRPDERYGRARTGTRSVSSPNGRCRRFTTIRPPAK